MLNLKACTVCFSMNSKLIDMDKNKLRFDFSIVSGLHIKDSQDMFAYLCVECASYIHRFIQFQRRCQRAYYALKAFLYKNINETDLEGLRNNRYHKSPLSYVDLGRIHYKEIQHPDDNHNQIIMSSSVQTHLIPVAHYNITVKDEKKYMTSNDIKVHENSQDYRTIDFEALNMDEADLKFENADYDQNEDTFDKVTTNDDDHLGHQTININEIDLKFENADNDLDDHTFDKETTNDSDILNDFDNDSFEGDAENYEPPEAAMIEQNKIPDRNEEGMSLIQEYAIIQPLTLTQAHAVMEVHIMFSVGYKHVCKVCNKRYTSDIRFKEHSRRHDKHTSGMFLCDICKFYFRSDNLLKIHMTEKHMYKYICRKCPEINYDRVSAKTHFYSDHCTKKNIQNSPEAENTPESLCNNGDNRKRKRVARKINKKKKSKLPEDYLKYFLQTQEEQYKSVLERQDTSSYKEAKYKCEFCYIGLRTAEAYSNHKKRHDPTISGELQCDMCKLRYKDHFAIYRHMVRTHLFKYACKKCDFVHANRSSAMGHYQCHMNKIYKCSQCDKEYKKPSSLATHIRYRHPTTVICNICGHSYISQAGLDNHMKRTHSKKDIEKSTSMIVNPKDPLYCSDCTVQFISESAFEMHLGSSSKHASTNLAATKKRGGDTSEHFPWKKKKTISIDNRGITTTCHICHVFLESEVKMRRHYRELHPGVGYPKRYICETCGHSTRHYSSLRVHMQKHTTGKPFMCPQCKRGFSTAAVLKTHSVIHTGEKPYECSHCNRRFTQKIGLKLHIQTVHLKIPYAPWDKKNRRRREMARALRQGLSAPDTIPGDE